MFCDNYKSMKGVDFVETNLNNLSKIIRPEVLNRSDSKNDRKGVFSSFKIQHSFTPETKSSINQALRPQIEKLKQIYKKQLDEQRKSKALLAQGKITREQFQKQVPKVESVPLAASQDKVTIDESGKIRDKQGNLIFLKNRTTELLINKKKQEQQQMKILLKKQKIKLHQRLGKSFLDRNLIVSSSKKRNRRSILGLQFLEKGSYQPVEHRKEVKEEIEDLNDVFVKKDDEIEMKIRKKRTIVSLQFNRDIPNLQWWDSSILSQKTYAQLLQLSDQTNIQQVFHKIDALKIQNHINWNQITGQYSLQKVGVSNDDDKIILPMFLTKEERKKLKRKRKHQKLLEKNDKIKLGLIEPEKPKLRIGNMAIVMKNQFIVDPSKIQAEAKKQTQQRLNKHLDSNNKRKLSKAQKKDKIIRKLKRDSAKQCRRAIFKIAKLIDPTQIFKVTMNAKQLALNGFVIKPSGQLATFPTMVLIQGGIRAVRFYRNLMINRIRWGENDPANYCKIVWEGEIENSIAGKWKVHEVGDEVQAIRILAQKKFDNLWEYVSNQ